MKTIDSDTLKTLNRRAVKREYNRALSAAGIAALDPDGVHLVAFWMPHGDTDHVRAQLYMKMREQAEPVEAFLDIHYDDFNKLIEIERNADGEWVVQR